MRNINKVSTLTNEFLQRISIIDDNIKSLWCEGKIDQKWSKMPTVAIVGSRKPTDYGRSVTLKLASALAARGVIIISGLALGHDALAARGALDAGGITVAVIGNGLNRIHPRSNQTLADEIITSGGAILSEYEPDYPVYKNNFLARNRLISALSDIVIIVEAGERSGTLNTAAHALTQGKELMAVPGNITSPLSVGCNRLIAQGATPIASAEDIIERLRQLYATRNGKISDNFLSIGHSQNDQSANVTSNNTDDEIKIIKAISDGLVEGDEILKASKLSVENYNVALTMLEINGQIKPLGANRWTFFK